jgi:hypothetical protein
MYIQIGAEAMPYGLMILTAAHVLPAVFWAGSTFVLARMSGAGGERLAFPQLGAALVAAVAGAGLWGLAHRSGFGPVEWTLAAGAGAALAALAIQASALPAVRRLGASPETEGTRRRVVLSQRLAAGILVVAVLCMSAARYA